MLLSKVQRQRQRKEKVKTPKRFNMIEMLWGIIIIKTEKKEKVESEFKTCMEVKERTIMSLRLMINSKWSADYHVEWKDNWNFNVNLFQYFLSLFCIDTFW